MTKAVVFKRNQGPQRNILSIFSALVTLSGVPGLVPSDVALDDDGLLSEELEVPPAEEAPDVPLDGDGRPGLCAAPLFLQLLVQEFLQEHLAKDVDVNIENYKETSHHPRRSTLVSPSW